MLGCDVDVAAGRLKPFLGELSYNSEVVTRVKASEPRDDADAKTRRGNEKDGSVDYF